MAGREERRIRASLARIWSELLASDPGLLRFRSACRATSSLVVTAAILGSLLAAQLSSVLALAIGAVFSIMAGSLPRDPIPRERLITTATMAGAGACSTVVTALLAQLPPAGDAGFVLLLFGAILVQTRGPRAVASGLVAVVVSYLTLFLHADLAHVPTALVALPIAWTVVSGIGLLLLPERPHEAIVRVHRTVARRAALLLHAIAEGDGEPGHASGLGRRRMFSDLNETILAAEEQLALLAPEAAARLSVLLLRFELALTHVAVAASAVRPLERRNLARIRLAARRLHAGRRSGLRRPDVPAALLQAIDEVEESAAELAAAIGAADLRRQGVVPRPAAGQARPALAWRPATRAGIAALLSMGGGYLISPDRWFWAVLSAYLLFLGARSSGDTIVKSVQRVWGSVVGLVVGVLVSVALSGHIALEGIGLVACVFGLTYVFAIAPTVAIFCVTVMLGLVYSLLGVHAETILLLRLEETAIGAAAAILVGVFVLPRPAHDLVRELGAKLLASLAEVLRRCAGRLDGEGDPDTVGTPDTVGKLREADRLFRDFRSALRPLQAGHALAWWARVPAEFPAILACMFWVRVLVHESRRPAGGDAAAVAATQRRLAAGFDRLANVGDGTFTEASVSTGQAPSLAPGDRSGPGASALALAVERLDENLAVLTERFQAEGWTGLVARRPI